MLVVVSVHCRSSAHIARISADERALHELDGMAAGDEAKVSLFK